MSKRKLYDFIAACDLVSKGRLMARTVWEQGTFIGRRSPVNEFINVPYVYMSTFRVKGIPMTKCKVFPWAPSQDDLFAEDWFLIDEYDGTPSHIDTPPSRPLNGKVQLEPFDRYFPYFTYNSKH